MLEKNPNFEFSHVLQKTGVLKNFSIAKVVPTIELENIKLEIRKKAKNEEDFKRMFEKKLAEFGNMHDPKNPIPGIIYLKDSEKQAAAYTRMTKELINKIKSGNPSKKTLAFLIKLMITEFGLTKEDFVDNQDSELDEDEY